MEMGCSGGSGTSRAKTISYQVISSGTTRHIFSYHLVSLSEPPRFDFETISMKLSYIHCLCVLLDNGYPHDDRADKNPYPHDRRADKDSYPHDSNNQCIILRFQLSIAMINVQLMLV